MHILYIIYFLIFNILSFFHPLWMFFLQSIIFLCNWHVKQKKKKIYKTANNLKEKKSVILNTQCTYIQYVPAWINRLLYYLCQVPGTQSNAFSVGWGWRTGRRTMTRGWSTPVTPHTARSSSSTRAGGSGPKVTKSQHN